MKYINFRSTSNKLLAQYLPIFIIFTCILSGLLLRIGSLSLLSQAPEEVLFQNSPLLTDLDAYYYLNNAKTLLANTYSSIDPLRAYPQGGSLPAIAPLLSQIVAFLSSVTSLDISWIACSLPPLLSLIVCIPVYLFAKQWGGKISAYFAICITSTSYIYATRTSFGMLDTDCMNVAFPFLISWFFYLFGKSNSSSRYGYCLIAFFLSILFIWWWDTAPSVVVLFTLFPFLVSLYFYYKNNNRLPYLFLFFTCLAGLVIVYALGIEHFKNLVSGLVSFVRYVLSSDNFMAEFPNTGISNLEQQSLTIEEISTNTAGNTIFLLLSIVGLVLMIYKNRLELIYLLPIFIVGLLSYSSVRFLIFLSPIIGISFGYFFHITRQIFSKYSGVWYNTICIGIGIFILYSSLTDPPLRTTFYSPEVIKGMYNIRHITPTNSVIYNWWDTGHPLVFWSERPTLADGMIHEPDRTVYLSVPLASNNYRFAANYMIFFANRGLAGINMIRSLSKTTHKESFDFIKNILSLGPIDCIDYLDNSIFSSTQPPRGFDSWIEFFFPSDSPPIYLFLEDRILLPGIQRWIYWYGTWQTDRLAGDSILQTIMLSPFSYSGGDINNSKYSFDVATGQLTMSDVFNAPINVQRITYFEKDHFNTIHYQDNKRISNSVSFKPNYSPLESDSHYYINAGDYTLEILPPPFVSLLQDSKIVDSLMKQLFLYKNNKLKPFFELVDEYPLKYQLWKVKGEYINNHTN